MLVVEWVEKLITETTNILRLQITSIIVQAKHLLFKVESIPRVVQGMGCTAINSVG